jgi:hypothetical protein
VTDFDTGLLLPAGGINLRFQPPLSNYRPYGTALRALLLLALPARNCENTLGDGGFLHLH